MDTLLRVERSGGTPGDAGSFGERLRRFRLRRYFSQMELALRVGVSQRHLSYVENGKAAPSRDLVLRLCEALLLSQRQSDEMVLAAGYAPGYSEVSLATPSMQDVRRAIELILKKQEPYPAVALDLAGNIQGANSAFDRLLCALGFTFSAEQEAANLPIAVFDPKGLKSRIANWDTVAGCLLGRVRRQLELRCYEPQLRNLLDRLEALVGDDGRVRATDSHTPSMPLELSHGAFRISIFSTVTTLGPPCDVASQNVLIESFFPADEVSDAALRGLKGKVGDSG